MGHFSILGNFLSILILYRRDMDLKPIFRQILITLISFDIFCIIFNLLLFCLPHLSVNFFKYVFPYIVPYVLPLAQIALTGKLFFKLLSLHLKMGLSRPLFLYVFCRMQLTGSIYLTCSWCYKKCFNHHMHFFLFQLVRS